MHISTERLYLLNPSEVTAEARLRYFQENFDYFKPFWPIRPPEMFTLPYIEQQLKQYWEDFQKDSKYRFFIAKKEAPQYIIGSFEFSNIVLGPFRSCNLGYDLEPAAQGKGYMHEALLRALDFIFSEKKLHRVEASVMLHNQKSIHVLERLGFEKIGLAKAYLNIYGNWEDHIIFQKINASLF